MSISPVERFHYLLQAILLLGLALFLAVLVKTDSLHYYLSPRTGSWIRFCPVPLGFMAVFTAYRAITPVEDEDPLCGCEHNVPASFPKRMFIYGMLAVPLAFGFLLPNRYLGSGAAAVKGFSLTAPLQLSHVPKNSAAPAAAGAPAGGKFEQNTGFGQHTNTAASRLTPLAEWLNLQEQIEIRPDTFSEMLGTLELYKEHFIGKKITLSGFVYRNEISAYPEGEFAVGRFLVLCCAADALPFGVLVKTSPEAAAAFNKDTWVKVSGTLSLQWLDGQEVLRIDAKRVVPVALPSNPYIYPNEDAGVTLRNS